MLTLLQTKQLRPILAVFVGAATTFAFAPYSIWPLAIFSPVLLLLLLSNISTKWGALTGFMWGIGQFAVGISWVHISIDTFGGMPKAASIGLMALLVAYLALYPTLYAGLLNRYFAKLSHIRFFVAAPALWVLLDMARGWVFTGFPWLWLGYSQIDSPLAGFAPIGGVLLVTLMLLLASSSLVYWLIYRRMVYLVVPIAIFAVGGILSKINWVTLEHENQTSFALVQANIPQELKWVPEQRWPTLLKFYELTQENLDSDIIIWPEAAIPAVESQVVNYLHNIDKVARESNSGLITGVLIKDNQGKFFNTVVALGETPSGEYNYQTQPRYKKHHLLPFGEFIPLEDLLRQMHLILTYRFLLLAEVNLSKIILWQKDDILLLLSVTKLFTATK